MKKTSSLIDSHFIMSLLIILFFLFTPFFTYAGSFYRCVDKYGNEIMSDYPLAEGTCKPHSSFKEITDQERINYEKEKEALEKKGTDEYEKKRANEAYWKILNECAQRAEKRHREGWNGDCALLYLSPGCALPVENAKRLDYNLQEEKNQCLQAYPRKP